MEFFIGQDRIDESPVIASQEGMSTQTVLSWELQAKGGVCPKCGNPFVAVETDNRYGKFKHYVPGCRCYQICITVGERGLYVDGRWNKDLFYWRPGCQKILIEERLRESKFCYGCGGEIPLPGMAPKIDWASRPEKVRKF